MPYRSDTPRPTLAEIRRAAPWLWLWCRNFHCRHKGPIALAPLIIRWGGDASSDLLRQSVRCKLCGSKGADLQHPSVRSSDIALAFHARAEDWGWRLMPSQFSTTWSRSASGPTSCSRI